MTRHPDTALSTSLILTQLSLNIIKIFGGSKAIQMVRGTYFYVTKNIKRFSTQQYTSFHDYNHQVKRESSSLLQRFPIALIMNHKT